MLSEKMLSEKEVVSPADMANDAAQRARRLIRILHGYGDALDIDALADAVADGVRRGAIIDDLPIMNRTKADMFAAAAASGAVTSTLELMAKRLAGSNESLTLAPFVKATPPGNISSHRHLVQAFSMVIAIVSVLVVVFKAV